MGNIEEVKRDEWYNGLISLIGNTEFFDNSIIEKGHDVLDTVNHVLNRLEQVCILLGHNYFNEVEAAKFLRLPDPEGSGKETIRNYALRHKKLSFHKVGRNGLIFQRSDLVEFLRLQKSEFFHESEFL